MKQNHPYFVIGITFGRRVFVSEMWLDSQNIFMQICLHVIPGKLCFAIRRQDESKQHGKLKNHF